MTAVPFVAVALRVFAIWEAQAGVMYFLTAAFGEPIADRAVFLIYGTLCLVCAAALWSFPKTLAARLLPETTNGALSSDTERLCHVGVIIAGLVLLVFAIPPFLSNLATLITVATSEGFKSELRANLYIGAGASLIQLVLALVLILKVRAVVDLVLPGGRAR